MVYQGVIPADLLRSVPVQPQEGGKTRFDQLYAAAMSLVFPEYRPDTLERFLGQQPPKGIKIWRICFPAKFQMTHVYMRAECFQEAFALGCDYACRASLRVFGQIPTDLTIRVMAVSERSLRRYLDIRWISKNHRRLQMKTLGKQFTPKMMYGARLAALGHPKTSVYALARYVEMKDLEKIRHLLGVVRVSAVESETFKRG